MFTTQAKYFYGAILALAMIGTIGIAAVAPPPKTSNKIKISKETTHWTEPVDAEGNVDYLQIINSHDRKGESPEDNAFIDLYRIFPVLSESPQKEKLLFDQLEIEKISDSDVRFIPFPYSDVEEINEIAEEFYERPWTDDEQPEVAKWIEQNEKVLHILEEASHKKCFSMPALPVLKHEVEDFYGDHPDEWRSNLKCEIFDFLILRTTLLLGQGKDDKAFSSIMLLQRLTNLMQSQRQWDVFVAGGLLQKDVAELHCLLLTSTERSSKWYGEKHIPIKKEIQEISFDQFAQLFDYHIRANSLFQILRQSQKNTAAMDRLMFSVHLDSPGLQLSNANFEHLEKSARNSTGNVDWNSVMQTMNHWLDEMIKAIEMPSYPERVKEIEQVLAKSQRWLTKELVSWRQAEILSSQVSILPNKIATSVYQVLNITDWLLGTKYNNEIVTRCNAMKRMVLIAYLLAAWQAEHDGQYPETLEQLSALAPIPKDPFTEKNFGYKRIASDSYMLFSQTDSRLESMTPLGFRERFGDYYDYRDPYLPLSLEDNAGVALTIRGPEGKEKAAKLRKKLKQNEN